MPVNYSPVEIVEEGEDEKGQLAPGLLQAELERVSVHHGRRVVEQLLGVRWGMEVPTTERKHHTTGSSPIPDYVWGREGGMECGRQWEGMEMKVPWIKMP